VEHRVAPQEFVTADEAHRGESGTSPEAALNSAIREARLTSWRTTEPAQ
jgi:hypothetical protein